MATPKQKYTFDIRTHGTSALWDMEQLGLMSLDEIRQCIQASKSHGLLDLDLAEVVVGELQSRKMDGGQSDKSLMRVQQALGQLYRVIRDRNERNQR